MVFENIITEIKGKVGIITLTRPKALDDQKEGMTVFAERRPPKFQNK